VPGHALAETAGVKHSLGVLSLAAALTAGCMGPGPQPWLRYELTGRTEWQPRSEGVYGGELLGADVNLDLYQTGTRIEVVVANATDQSLTFRVGPDAGAPLGAIGQVLLRRLDGGSVGGPDMMEYAALQPIVVDGGWRATFFIDEPLGREVKLGQYLVFAVEAENTTGTRARRTLPVIARRSGTVPTDG
jgi:hypothetical protein